VAHVRRGTGLEAVAAVRRDEYPALFHEGPMSRRPLIAMSVAYLLLLCAASGTGGLWPV
jgi:hypothetical protein